MGVEIMVVCSDFLEEGEVVWLCEGGKECKVK